MKRWYGCGVLVLLVLVGCGGDKTGKPGSNVIVDPRTFFPMETGARWTYAITVNPSREPLNYGLVSWPQGDRALVYATRGRFRGVLKDKARSTFNLALSVEGPATKIGQLVEHNLVDGSVKLKVEVDELGVYEGLEGVYLVPHREGESSSFMINRLRLHPWSSSPAGMMNSVEEGLEVNTVFFVAENDGMGLSPVNDEDDVLYFVGEEGGKLHYKRVVLSEKDKESRESIEAPDGQSVDLVGIDEQLGKGFQEDMWFEAGKGMVRLVQTIDDTISMEWNLVSFQPGIAKN